jgi:ribulose-phosphate 3-epimerase
MANAKIAPSLLAADFLRLGDEVAAAEAGGADRLHLDVMDGVFVPNLSFGMPVIEALRHATHLPLEAHLMVAYPDRLIDAVAAAGADAILVHVEAAVHLDRVLAHIHGLGKRAGVVLNPATPLTTLDEIVPRVDTLLLMTVNPGFGGQRLIDYTIDKVRRARALLDSRNPACEIEVDGGVDVDTARPLVEAGAQVLVAGTSVFRRPGGAAEGIRGLLDVLK